MKIKMGNFLAANLNAAERGSGPWTGTKIRVGKRLIQGGGKTLRGATRAGKAVGSLALGAGGEVAGLGGKVLQRGYNELLAAPPVAKLVAGAVPSALIMKSQAADQLTPLVNDAIREGRQVYANDNSFLEKKAALSEKILEKTASLEKRSGAVGDFLQSLASGSNMSSPQNDPSGGFLHGLGGLIGGASPPMSSAVPGKISGSIGRMLPGVGNMMSAIGGQGLQEAGQMFGRRNNQMMGIGDTTAYRLNKSVNSLFDRVRGDETFAQSFFQSAGTEAAKGLAGLLKDMASSAYTTVKHAPAQNAMIQNMQANDPILMRADPELLANSYHSMAKFAPTLSTDENAVRSFLRESVMAGNGPDYATIANLAKAEASLYAKPRS